MSDEIHTARIQPTQIHTQPAIPPSVLAGIVQEESEIGFEQWADQAAFSPTLMARRFEQLEDRLRRSRREESAKSESREKEELLVVHRLEEVSEQFQRKNPELQARSLLLLRSKIKEQDLYDEILRKVMEMYPDFSLADEAIDFLLRTTKGQLAAQVRLAKETLNATYGREVRAGRNIAQQAREFSTKGLGRPTTLRDLYREVTGNPRDANALFNELSSQFEYAKMKPLIDFLLHSLGSDLKSKGPSIDAAELQRLITETRKLQSILGIFRFFNSRMTLILRAFERQGVLLPAHLTFEELSKLFMKLLQERYPSAEKILKLALQLGLSEEIIAQIIILTQMRDGVRNVAPKLFKSEQHRQDILKAFIDVIEELDERAEEEEEKGKEGKKGKKNNSDD